MHLHVGHSQTLHLMHTFMTRGTTHSPGAGMVDMGAPLGVNVGEFSVAGSSSFLLVGVYPVGFQPGVVGEGASACFQNSVRDAPKNSTSGLEPDQGFLQSFQGGKYVGAPDMFGHSPEVFWNKISTGTVRFMAGSQAGIGSFSVDKEDQHNRTTGEYRWFTMGLTSGSLAGRSQSISLHYLTPGRWVSGRRKR